MKFKAFSFMIIMNVFSVVYAQTDVVLNSLELRGFSADCSESYPSEYELLDLKRKYIERKVGDDLLFEFNIKYNGDKCVIYASQDLILKEKHKINDSIENNKSLVQGIREYYGISGSLDNSIGRFEIGHNRNSPISDKDLDLIKVYHSNLN